MTEDNQTKAITKNIISATYPIYSRRINTGPPPMAATIDNMTNTVSFRYNDR
jgi:hypothetical protein